MTTEALVPEHYLPRYKAAGKIARRYQGQPCEDPAPWIEKLKAQWALLENLQNDLGILRGKTVEGLITFGRLLTDAKTAVGYGTWGTVVKEHLSFIGDQDTAAYYMKIASHPVLADSEYFRNLPPAVTTLYYLSRLPEALVRQGITQGLVHPAMTKQDAVHLPAKLNAAELGPKLAPWSPQEVNRIMESACDSWLQHGPLEEMGKIEGCLRQYAAFLQEYREKRERLPAAGIEILRRRRAELVRTFGETARYHRTRAELDALDHLIEGRVCGRYERQYLDEAYEELAHADNGTGAGAGSPAMCTTLMPD